MVHMDPGLGPRVLTQALIELEGEPHMSVAGWCLPTVAGQSGTAEIKVSRPALKDSKERDRSLRATGMVLNNLGPSTVRCLSLRDCTAALVPDREGTRARRPLLVLVTGAREMPQGGTRPFRAFQVYIIQ